MEKSICVNEENNRISIWDNLKFILIFLVVLGHILEPLISDSINLKRLYIFIYTFHMPAFIFISGLFSKKAVEEKNYKKIFEFIIIYLFAAVIYYLCEIFVGGGNALRLDLFNIRAFPWYALSVASFYFITFLFKNVNKKYLFLSSVIFSCIALYYKNLGSFLSLSRTIVFYPFFCAGYLLDASKIYKNLKSIKYKISSVLFFMILGIFVYVFAPYIPDIIKFLYGSYSYNNIEFVGCFGGVYRLICYFISFCAIFFLISICPQNKSIVSIWGKRTLNVYLLHYCFVAIIKKILVLGYNIGDLFFIGYYFVIPLSIFVTILFSLKVWVKPVDFLLKLKYYK